MHGFPDNLHLYDLVTGKGRYAKTKISQKADVFERDAVCFSFASRAKQ
jgi:hypothetical protein